VYKKPGPAFAGPFVLLFCIDPHGAVARNNAIGFIDGKLGTVKTQKSVSIGFQADSI
jgi:hypothetical protein